MNEVDALLINYDQQDKLKIIAYIQVWTERCNIIRTFDNQILESLTNDEKIGDGIMTSSDYNAIMQRHLIALIKE